MCFVLINYDLYFTGFLGCATIPPHMSPLNCFICAAYRLNQKLNNGCVKFGNVDYSILLIFETRHNFPEWLINFILPSDLVHPKSSTFSTRALI